MKDRLNDIAYCGIYCGACPHHLGYISGSARTLRQWLEGFNFDDIAQFILPAGSDYGAFKDVLGSIAGQEPCDGCRDQGNPLCPIKICAKDRRLDTCAGCGDFSGDPEKPCSNDEAVTIFRFITRRYSGWNLKNLGRIGEIGMEAFLEEMNQNTKDGFSTCEVISKKKVFSD